MGVLNNLLEDSKTIPQTFDYKLDNVIFTLEDQQEALTNPEWSFWFAKANIPGSDIKALQAKACEDPYYAYNFAKYISGADIKYCQEHACKEPRWAYIFAIDIPGADIKYCQEHACKKPNWAHMFASHIPDADMGYCR